MEAAAYPETVNITRSGTPTAPITFLSNTSGSLDATTVGAGFLGAVAPHGFTVTGAHDVVIRGFAVQSCEAYLITDSSRITVEQSLLNRATAAPFIRITGSSSNVTVSRVALLRPGGSAVANTIPLALQVAWVVWNSRSRARTQRAGRASVRRDWGVLVSPPSRTDRQTSIDGGRGGSAWLARSTWSQVSARNSSVLAPVSSDTVT